ncbi:MAG: transaldolase, partial [Acidimicrobiales bacterium]
MTKLHDLYEKQGQSPWLDNLRRDYLTNGILEEMLRNGIRGITSNPTTFAKAIEGPADYDEQFGELLASHSVEDAYWEMAINDIEAALKMFEPLFVSSGGVDGFVSLEVAPSLAHDTPGTISAARGLHERINRPNLFVKVPGTAEGVEAIRTMISEGRSINVTLLFSLERYVEVIEAYMGGLEDLLASGKSDLSGVASVASFFVSRVDTEVDRRLETMATEAEHADRELSGAGLGDRELAAKLRSRLGTTAVAQAREAYRLFTGYFTGERWGRLAAAGARPQRLLWASTSTKNPNYPDLIYVDSLIGPE